MGKNAIMKPITEVNNFKKVTKDLWMAKLFLCPTFFHVI